MSELDRLLAANADAAGRIPLVEAAPPARGVAIVTCMDARLDPLPAFGLAVGDAHVLRNAGGRVTDDVLRSLAVSVGVLGVRSVLVVQHTRCGLLGPSDDALRARTGADDVEFLVFPDHAEALRADVERLRATPYLQAIEAVVGGVYDVDTGRVDEVVRWEAGT